jgi:2-polyprenyl-3-methyl-5-hydroxy-6-metoxy-1,4-benzoquinol methylase
MLRVTRDELLDNDLGTPEEIRASLEDLWRINRRLGGVSSNLKLLERFFAKTGPHPVRVLDVGAGDARLAHRLREKLAAQKIRADIVALDRRRSHLGMCANGNRLPSVAADVFRLPFRNEAFDVVMCNLFFHHFSGQSARDLLRRMAAAAREAVLVNDLERHWLPYLFIRCARPFARSRITRHDGPASVRQAYTRPELEALVREAGFTHFDTMRLSGFRWGLILWKA